MIKQLIRITAITVTVLIAITTIAIPVYAYIDNPTSMSIQSMLWFRNVAVIGDMAGVFHYQIEYEDYPETPASSTIVFRLYDTDGVTTLATVKPYVYALYETHGYGDGMGIFYIANAENMTWGGEYKVNILGLPAYYTGLSPTTYTMASLNWNDSDSDTASQREELYNYIMTLCDDFKSIYPDIPLKTTTDGTVALSVYGESYLSGAMPGLYSMCPEIFFSQIYVPQVIPTDNYTMALAIQYRERLQDTDVERGLKRVGEELGVDEVFIAGAMTFIACVGACIYAIRRQWGLESGLLISGGIVLLAAVVVGDTLFTIAMVGMLAAGILLAWILHFKRTT